MTVNRIRIRYSKRACLELLYFNAVTYHVPVPVAERSKARVCGRSLAETEGSNPAGGMDVCVL